MASMIGLWSGLIILAVADAVVPIPFAAALLMYVVLDRPAWFKKLVNRLYEH